MRGPRSIWTLLGAAGALALTAGVSGAAGTTTVDSTPSVYSVIAPHHLRTGNIADSGTFTQAVTGGTTTVPTTATSVQLQVIVSAGSAAGSLKVYPFGGGAGAVELVVWAAGETVTQQLTVGVGTGGKVMMRNGTGSVSVDLTVTGYYAPAATAAPGGGVSNNDAVCTVTSTTYTSTGGCSEVSVTLTTGTHVLVIVTANIAPTTGHTGDESFAVSGVTTLAVNDDWAVVRSAGSDSSTGALQASTTTYLTVTAGSNTFTLQQHRDSNFGGTVQLSDRTISVVPLN